MSAATPGLLRGALRQAEQSLRVLGQSLYWLLRGERRPGAVLTQLFEVGNRSVVFVILTLGFLGAIITLQAGFQALRIIGDTALVGPQSLPLLVRQLGPTLTGLMVATRVGTGIAAELGSMVVTEQVDALRMNHAPPVDYLIKPRLVACVVMLPVLTALGVAAAFGAGLLTALAAFQTQPAVYARFDVVSFADLAEGASKALAYGVVIPVIAGASGLAAHGGSAGVGEATTRAVVGASLAVIALDFLLGGLAFLVFK